MDQEIGRLSARHLDVLGLIADGLANKEIATALGITSATVKGYVEDILLALAYRTGRRRARAGRRSWRAGSPSAQPNRRGRPPLNDPRRSAGAERRVVGGGGPAVT